MWSPAAAETPSSSNFHPSRGCLSHRRHPWFLSFLPPVRHPADITPLTYLDYPKKAACILWYTGCNLRCPYCYNPELVLRQYGGRDEISFLEERRGFLDAVVLSGGECTLNPDILELCRTIKGMGYLVKIDTNGSNPEVVQALADEKLIDYVAVDNKMPSRRSWHLPGGALLFDRFCATLRVLQRHALPHEVRTTVHPALLDEADILRMIHETHAQGYRDTYYLQLFFHDDPQMKTLGNMPPPERRYDRRLLDETSPLKIGYRNFPEDRFKY